MSPVKGINKLRIRSAVFGHGPLTAPEAAIPHQTAVAEAQRKSEALNAIIASAMDAIISINAQRRVVLFNPAAEIMFGVPAREALGQSINRFIPDRFRLAHSRHVQGSQPPA
jgi:PAS domain-containing protein